MGTDVTNDVGYIVTSYDVPHIALFDWFPFIYEACCHGMRCYVMRRNPRHAS